MKKTIRILQSLIMLVAILPAWVAAAEFKAIEPKLIGAMHKVSHEKLDDALEDIQGLLKETPKFHLAQLVYADLLMAKAGLPGQLRISSEPLADDRINDLRHEAKVRWRRYQEKSVGESFPDVLLQLSPEQTTAVVADLSRSRLYLYENVGNKPQLLADFYVTQGKNGVGKRIEGDSKTPQGAYFVTSSLDTSKLPDLYGSGAFPIDYPNAWDRRQGNTGHGIWLHGVPSDTYSRAPLATRGCLAMSNPELDAIKPFLHSGVTPVIIGDHLNWSSPDEIAQQKIEIQGRISQWLLDWQSRDVDIYLQHYSRQFKSDNKDHATWSAHKRRVNKQKQYIDVKLSNVSILGYPGQEDMRVVSYDQDYRSNNFKGKSSKRQYWKKEADGRWRIIYEGKG